MLSFTDPALTVEEANTYLQAAGLDEEVHDVSLMRAQRYIAATYNPRWLIGFDNDAAPEAVKYAIAEAARRETTVPGSLAPDYTPAARVVAESIGEISVRYDESGAASPVIPIIDGLLAGYIRPAVTRTKTAYVVRA